MQNGPVLKLGLALYLNAFFDLDNERRRGKYEFIPRSACFQYAVDYELDEWQSDDLWYYVSHMDLALLKWQKDKEPPTPEPPK